MSAEFKHIEWHHIDKKKFYAVWSLSYLSINMCSYPALLVKTRLQVQTTRRVYKNTFHAFTQITRTEGWRGLYKGFFVGQLNLMADYMYYTSYEVSREQLSALSFGARGFFAGSVAAAAEQCFCCPVDVVSQRLMIQRHSNGAKTVVTSLLANSGFCGLYRGFTAAIMQEGVQNGVLWASYGIILDLIGCSVPVATPRIVIQGSAGAVSGLIAAVIGNPLDIIRVRMQVKGEVSVVQAFKNLIQIEGVKALSKGMFPNVLTQVPSSTLSILVYETVKRYCLTAEAKSLWLN